MNRCKDCKHWGPDGYYFSIDGKKHCRSRKVLGSRGADDDGVENNGHMDENCQFGPEFGCVHWEAKE